MVTTTEVTWAEIVLSEILNDTSPWWQPISDDHEIFEQSYMKFLNGNLNYFSYENMLLSLIEGYQYNKNLPKTLEFCEFVKVSTSNRGPFGRMCVWKIPPGAELLPHTDNFTYHEKIIRNIFIVSKHNNNNSSISIQGQSVEYDQGTLFQFRPAQEEHAFKNNSEQDWYFLGFDFWIPECLLMSLRKENLFKSFYNKTRRRSNSSFGVGDSKFMSRH